MVKYEKDMSKTGFAEIKSIFNEHYIICVGTQQ